MYKLPSRYKTDREFDGGKISVNASVSISQPLEAIIDVELNPDSMHMVESGLKYFIQEQGLPLEFEIKYVKHSGRLSNVLIGNPTRIVLVANGSSAYQNKLKMIGSFLNSVMLPTIEAIPNNLNLKKALEEFSKIDDLEQAPENYLHFPESTFNTPTTLNTFDPVNGSSSLASSTITHFSTQLGFGIDKDSICTYPLYEEIELFRGRSKFKQSEGNIDQAITDLQRAITISDFILETVYSGLNYEDIHVEPLDPRLPQEFAIDGDKMFTNTLRQHRNTAIARRLAMENDLALLRTKKSVNDRDHQDTIAAYVSLGSIKMREIVNRYYHPGESPLPNLSQTHSELQFRDVPPDIEEQAKNMVETQMYFSRLMLYGQMLKEVERKEQQLRTIGSLNGSDIPIIYEIDHEIPNLSLSEQLKIVTAKHYHTDKAQVSAKLELGRKLQEIKTQFDVQMKTDPLYFIS